MGKYDILDEETEYEETEDNSQKSTGYSILNDNNSQFLLTKLLTILIEVIHYPACPFTNTVQVSISLL